MSARAAELEAAGVAFVEATVVRCASPTSARPGDRAIVLGDGTIDGFVGGSCADATVRLQALRALETGEPILLRILPGAADGPAGAPGAVVVANPCLSGGALELFLEPRLPAPRVAIAGASPVARALVELAGPLGFLARLDAEAEPGDFAAVVASLGHGDEDALRCGLAAGCEYVGLVASRRRGRAVLDGLRAAGVPEESLARVRTPAGVDIGARTHAEIALSILAELVATRRARSVGPDAVAAPGQNGALKHVAAEDAGTVAAPSQNGALKGGAAEDAGAVAVPGQNGALKGGAAEDAGVAVPGQNGALKGGAPEAVDPVCGMVVAVGPETPTAGEEAFCCEGCRDAWLARAG